MSLEKIYQLKCDGTRLLRMRDNSLIGPLYNRCMRKTSPNSSSTGARKEARNAGWIRHHEDFPLIAAHPSAGSSKHPFDLCPRCAEVLLPD